MIESKLKAKNCNPDPTLDSCFDLVGSRRQHGVASNEVNGWSTEYPLNADGDGLK